MLTVLRSVIFGGSVICGGMVAYAGPALACEASFRSGMAAFARADALTRDIEHRLYHGVSWASRGAVLERLEAASGATTALGEIHDLQEQVTTGLGALQRARGAFLQAVLRCDPVNRQRANDNLDAMTDTQAFLETHDAYLHRLAREAGGG